MGLNQEIGCRLKMLREEKRKTQKEISKVLNVTPAAYGKIEAGDRGLGSEYCIQLADYFGVTCDYILRGVSSENIDICSRTGLRQETISVLENNMQRMEKADDYIQRFRESIKSNIVNFLIQSHEFLDELAMDTLGYCICLKANIKTYGYIFPDDGALEHIQEPQQGVIALLAENTLNAARFSANENFSKFYAAICSDIDLISKYSNLSEEEKEMYIRIGLFKSKQEE